MIDWKKTLICHLQWMSHYEGEMPPPNAGGGEYAGGEEYNFLKYRGNFYGYTQPRGKAGPEENIKVKIQIHRLGLGVSRNAKKVDGVTVIWTATHTTEGGRRIVGWYRDATIYRCPQDRPDNREPGYRMVAKCSGSCLIPDKERKIRIEQKYRTMLYGENADRETRKAIEKALGESR